MTPEFTLMNTASKKHTLTHWVVWSVIGSGVFNFVSVALPFESPEQNLTWKLSIVLIMIAFACMSRAIGKKGEDIPAAGFSVLAISQGIFFSAIPLTGSSNYEAIAGAMFYLPAMIMICFSRTFPLWVRIYGIVSSAPFLYIMFAVHSRCTTSHSYSRTSSSFCSRC